MNELALFAGAGGGILGGHLLGWRTVCAVEWEQYPASVLCARQNDKIFPSFPIWDDVQTFDGNPWRGIVDVVSGGFPCQDISAAGGGGDITGSRSSMWKHMARIIGEVRPKYAFVENSPMLTTRGLGVVLADLSTMGFDAKWGVVSAADVGANHQRERIWIRAEQRNFLSHTQHNGDGWEKQQPESVEKADVAYSVHNGLQGVWQNGATEGSLGLRSRKGSDKEQYIHMAHAQDEKNVWWDGKLGIIKKEYYHRRIQTNGRRKWWATEPNVGRVANGVAARVDRLKAIGNGQVPLCAATAWELLK